jgi:hypothetical protein
VSQQFFNAKTLRPYWAVLCSNDAANHVHDQCVWSPVTIVLAGTYREDDKGFVIASVFSSGECHDVPTIFGPSFVACQALHDASILFGSTIQWLSWMGNNEIHFDLVT